MRNESSFGLNKCSQTEYLVSKKKFVVGTKG